MTWFGVDEHPFPTPMLSIVATAAGRRSHAPPQSGLTAQSQALWSPGAIHLDRVGAHDVDTAGPAGRWAKGPGSGAGRVRARW